MLIGALMRVALVAPIVTAGTSPESGSDLYQATGWVVESADETILAFLVQPAIPPNVTGVALEDWSWPHNLPSSSSDGFRLSERQVTVVGNWDGETLRVKSISMEESAAVVESQSETIPTENCDRDDALAVFSEFNTTLQQYLDAEEDPRVVSATINTVNGICGVSVSAVAESPVLDQLIGEFESRTVLVEYLVTPAQQSSGLPTSD